MGIWNRHAGVLFHLLHLQFAVCRLTTSSLRPCFLLHTVGNLVPACTDPFLAFSRCHRGREFGEVEKLQLGRRGSGLRSHWTPKSLCALAGTVLPTFPSCPNSQLIVEELEIQRGHVTCPKSHGEAGHWPPCLASEQGYAPLCPDLHQQ